jgi:hypothetical protein
MKRREIKGIRGQLVGAFAISVVGIASTGCGGSTTSTNQYGSNNSLDGGQYGNQNASARNDGSTPKSEGKPPFSRRGLQTPYLARYSPGFLKDICSALKKAPSGSSIELSVIPVAPFAVAGKEWTNAASALRQLNSRSVILSVYFGEGKMSSLKSPEGWADSFYQALFSKSTKNATFVLSPAYEQDPAEDFQTQTSSIVAKLEKDWSGDANQKGKAFPYDRLRIRHTVSLVPSTNVKILAENEYQLNGKPLPLALPDGYSVYGNHGTLAFSPEFGEKEKLAFSKDFLPAVELDSAKPASVTLKSLSQGKALLLWHPALDLWRWDSAGYYRIDGAKVEVTGPRRKNLLKELADFVAK